MKAAGTDDLSLFTYGNHFIILIFSIYLFIYSNRCQEHQRKSTPFVYLLMQIAC